MVLWKQQLSVPVVEHRFVSVVARVYRQWASKFRVKPPRREVHSFAYVVAPIRQRSGPSLVL